MSEGGSASGSENLPEVAVHKGRGVSMVWLVPVVVFLTGGSLLLSNTLGKMAAIGSSEHILGDYVPAAADDDWLNYAAREFTGLSR